MKRLWLSGIIMVILAMLLVSCGGYGAPAPASTTTTSGTGNAVTLSGFAFSPATLTVKVGTKVTWTNKDSTTHTVTSDGGAFESGNLVPNGTFSYTFNTAGTFPYHCAIHTYMTGKIVVQ